jgi:hypothetical protein
LLGLHHLSDFYNWAGRNGIGKLPGMLGFRWVCGEEKQREIMARIRGQIIPARGVRITAEEIPGFPEVDVQAELYDLEGSGKLERAYEEMAEALEELKSAAADDVSPDHPLSRILRARQEIEILKVPLAEELARDYLAKGYSVGIFVNYSQTLAELRRRLACDNYIDGTQTGKPEVRQACIDRFMSNEDRLTIVNSEAGGVSVSLHDIHGGHPRVGLVMPDYSARRMLQVFGRFPRVGGKTRSLYRVLLAANTVEESVHRAFRRRAGNLEALNDADLSPDGVRFKPQKI